MAQIKLKTLTPVHIGDGESYTQFSYFTQENRIYFIDSEAFSLLSPQQMTQLLQGKQGLQLFLEHNPNLRHKMKPQAKYHLPLYGKPRQEVFTFIKSGTSVYIPGTEVKGALRTALLNFLLGQPDFKQQLIHQLQKFDKEFPALKKNKRKLKKQAERLESSIQALAFRPHANDAKYDLLKFISVGDSDLKRASDVLVVAPVSFVGLTKSIREQFHEVTKPEIEFSLEIIVTSGKPKEEFLSKFGFHSLQQNALQDRHSLFHIAYQFYKIALNEEISYFKSRGHQYSPVVRKLQHISNLNKPDSPVIRLGKHQGYLSLTLGTLLKKATPEFYSKVIPRLVEGKTYPGNFPKSRKLVRVNGEMFPLGWVQLS